MNTLLVRCEATPMLGTGHAMRCLALGQEWMRRGGRAVFAMSEPEPGMAARLERSGVGVVALRSVAGSSADASETSALAQAWGSRWVVLDGPMFGAAWDVGWAGEVRLLRIDDNGLMRPFRAELLLNQNLGAAVSDYPRKAGPGRLLLGPEYALLRPEFFGVARAARTGRIVVTLGGTDPACASERVLDALEQPSAQGVAADFIIGAANPRRVELAGLVAAHAPRLQAVVAPENLPERFARAAMAVTAGGSTLYELALLRTPMLVLCTAENQRRTCERLAAIGAAQYAGWHAEVTPATLAELITSLGRDAARREELVERAGCLGDGHGAARVVDAMLGGGR